MNKINSLQVCVLSRVAHNKPSCILVFYSKDNKNKCEPSQMGDEMIWIVYQPLQ